MFYVIWNINGIYYDITRLPPNYVPQQDGLLIVGSNDFEDITLQCLVYSDLLWKQSYYYSEVTVIPRHILGKCDYILV